MGLRFASRFRLPFIALTSTITPFIALKAAVWWCLLALMFTFPKSSLTNVFSKLSYPDDWDMRCNVLYWSCLSLGFLVGAALTFWHARQSRNYWVLAMPICITAILAILKADFFYFYNDQVLEGVSFWVAVTLLAICLPVAVCLVAAESISWRKAAIPFAVLLLSYLQFYHFRLISLPILLLALICLLFPRTILLPAPVIATVWAIYVLSTYSPVDISFIQLPGGPRLASSASWFSPDPGIAPWVWVW